MTARQFQPGYSLADTTALTTSNVFDVTSTYALNLSAGSGTRTASSTHTHSGGNTAMTVVTSGQNSVMRYPFATATKTAAVEWVFYYGGTAPSGTPDSIGGPTDGGSINPWTLNINTLGKLVVTITGGTAVWTAASALSGAGWYRFACKYVIDTTSTGTLQCAYYSDAGTTAIETSSALTGLNLGTGSPTNLELGRRNVPATAASYWHTDVQVNDGATAFQGPMAAPTVTDTINELWGSVPDTVVVFDTLTEISASQEGGTADNVAELWAVSVSGLTIDAGPDATLEPNTVAKLTPVISTSPTTVSYTQTGGPSVSLVGAGTNRAYLTPSLSTASTLTFQVTATPVVGSPVSDTVVHTIYPQQLWALSATRVKVPAFLGGTPLVVPDPG